MCDKRVLVCRLMVVVVAVSCSEVTPSTRVDGGGAKDAVGERQDLSTVGLRDALQ